MRSVEIQLCNKRPRTAVQILCSVLVEDNFGITVHYLEIAPFFPFPSACYVHMPDCVVLLYLAVKDMTLGNSCMYVV